MRTDSKNPILGAKEPIRLQTLQISNGSFSALRQSCAPRFWWWVAWGSKFCFLVLAVCYRETILVEKLWFGIPWDSGLVGNDCFSTMGSPPGVPWGPVLVIQFFSQLFFVVDFFWKWAIIFFKKLFCFNFIFKLKLSERKLLKQNFVDVLWNGVIFCSTETQI